MFPKSRLVLMVTLLFVNIFFCRAQVFSFSDAYSWKKGKIDLPEAHANLRMPKGYRWIGAEESKMVAEDFWGLPASRTQGLLGLVARERIDPTQNQGWGLLILYQPIGWVNDQDTALIEDPRFLSRIEQGLLELQAKRRKAHLEGLDFNGWPLKPGYDGARHQLHWAKSYRDRAGVLQHFYEAKCLSRHGVLSLHVFGTADHDKAMAKDLQEIANAIQFSEGNRYQDYRPGQDLSSGFQLAGLISGSKATAGIDIIQIQAFVQRYQKQLLLGASSLFSLFLLIGLVKKWTKTSRKKDQLNSDY